MKHTLALILATAGPLAAGPYAPPANEPGTTAVSESSPDIVGWATAVESYTPGEDVDAEWRDTALALGPTGDDAFHITCLGRGGRITLSFDNPIADGDGSDFAVFENAISHGFLELAFVEVSSDGEHFVRFPNRSLTESPVGAYGSLDATDIDGFAGKYIRGEGTPFDLADLAGDPELDIHAVRYVRLIDVVGGEGPGSALAQSTDSTGAPIHDPYPTTGSAGFDLDAIAVLSQAAPEPLEVTSMAVVENDFRLTWNAEPDFDYVIEASTELNDDWETVGEVTAGDATGTFQIARDGFPDRFFRVREVE